MNVLLIGSGAREHSIARAIKKSKINNHLYCFGSNNNPGILKLSKLYKVGKIDDQHAITDFALENSIDLAIVGPESPLAKGVVDELKKVDISVVGPTLKLAQLETSKSFTRELMKKYNIPGQLIFKSFNSLSGIEEFINQLNHKYVVKFDGLMGGKGVKVAGEHLDSLAQTIEYCSNIIENNGKFLIEQKLVGEEFSLMSFCDGTNLIHMPPIQDHKRAFINDRGPNTGGMGSYNDINHSLPFLTQNDIFTAQSINNSIAKSLKQEFGVGYQGIIYGGFMVTADGIKVIEFNARFGDPEVINVLALLQSDFLELCIAITEEKLDEYQVKFSKQATVCKYAVPNGYPENPVKGKTIDISKIKNPDLLYFASVDQESNNLIETGSRALAVIGIADTLVDAENIAQSEIARIDGPLFHRKDIGSAELILKKVENIKKLKEFNN